jgi:TPR repeat protein
MRFFRSLILLPGVLVALLVLLGHPAAAQRPIVASATAVLDTAIERMGGTAVLRGVQRARFEMVTQWQRTAFDARPYADQPSYELHADLRDYALDAWRNTRRFSTGTAWREITDVVRDSVAIRRAPGGPGGMAAPTAAAGAWAPLNIAYVDEKRELFALAPERLLLAARDARDLRALSDTAIAGAPHARVSATVAGFSTTILLRRSTGMLTAARFRTAEPNDFGLVPWGEMDVELWYSAWRTQPGGIVYPFQWDVRRVGQPYKRMTVLGAIFNPPSMPDSFVVTDSLRAAYRATAMRPMHDIPLDSARLVDGRFASFGAPGSPAGAVKLGRQWVMLGGGQAPLSAERAAAWLERSAGGGPIAGALLSAPATGNGGAAWLASHGVPLYATPATVPFVAAVLRGHGASLERIVTETNGRWLRVDGDSLWLEPMDLPDAPGALVAYVPSLEWVYTGSANPLHVDLVLSHARALGWHVTHVGSPRAVTTPLAPPR